MKKYWVVILIVCLLLTGCSTNIKSGIVYDKSYTPSHEEVRAQVAYVNGSSAVIPTTVYVPESYRISIKNSEGKTANYCVTEEDYNSVQIGELWQMED